MEDSFWSKIHPAVYLIALALFCHICSCFYKYNIKIESRLQNHLNEWVRENGGEYKNATSLSIENVLKDYNIGYKVYVKVYVCRFITYVKDENGVYGDCYKEGVAVIMKLNKKAKRMYGISENFKVVGCEWDGQVKSLRQVRYYNDLE